MFLNPSTAFKWLPDPLEVLARRTLCYGLLTIMTLQGVTYFFTSSLFYPVRFIAPKLFRRLCTLYLAFIIPGFLCVPFSWVGCKMIISGYGWMRENRNENVLFVANHSGRVDWMFGLLLGIPVHQRVAFITEAFIMYLPFIGWFRYLMEDMFVFRSFKRDKDRLLKNITDFHEANVKRWVFLCPEGHIADFNASDKKYIQDCETFSKEMGFDPFEFVLTPRYKGMQVFNQLLTKGDEKKKAIVISPAMSYKQNGITLTKALKSPDRVTPDLWSMMNGNLECHIQLHKLELSNDPVELKKQLMEDYSLKDKALKCFHDTGKYPKAMPGKSVKESPENWKGFPDSHFPIHKPTSGTLPCEQYQDVHVNHLQSNLFLLLNTLFSIYFCHLVGLGWILKPLVVYMYIAVALTHLGGEFLANGQSRESLPFEGILKAIVFRLKGIEGGEEAESGKTKKQTQKVNPNGVGAKIE